MLSFIQKETENLSNLSDPAAKAVASYLGIQEIKVSAASLAMA